MGLCSTPPSHQPGRDSSTGPSGCPCPLQIILFRKYREKESESRPGTGLFSAESQVWDPGSLGSGPSSASDAPCDPGPVPALPWGWGLGSQALTPVLHLGVSVNPVAALASSVSPLSCYPTSAPRGGNKLNKVEGAQGDSIPGAATTGVIHLPLMKTRASYSCATSGKALNLSELNPSTRAHGKFSKDIVSDKVAMCKGLSRG